YPVTPTKYNIVVVLTDDLSDDLVRYMPAVKRLQEDGVRFSRYIVSNSLCCPSRTSIFTGRLPHNTQVRTNLPPFGGYEQFITAGNAYSTFGTSLAADGYRVALFGKSLNGYKAYRDPPFPGFSDWAATASGYRQVDYTLNVDGVPVQYGHSRSEFLNRVLENKGRRFIRTSAAAGQPFMLEISSFSPHAPFAYEREDADRYPYVLAPRGSAFGQANRNPPAWLAGHPPFTQAQRERLDRNYRKRIRSVLSVNRLLLGLRKEVRASGVADRTFVIFSSDNGFHVGQHRLLLGKQTAFDHDIRVPLVAAGPGIPPGSVTSVLAQNTDLRPTFEALGGLTPSADVDGMNLIPWMQNPALGGGRPFALIEHKRETRKTRADPDVQNYKQGDPPDYDALRLPDATYVEYVTGEREYYDLVTDPDELDNVYATLPDEYKAQLAAKLAQLRTCTGQECNG
ncbi:MAG: N-acetylglucosamine-6-sulfatase, partial [Solirubrobacteraceae bacterium]|nr:N-acetylglucosamine-6-sulfatase [Solirubrobacteraceae bacterium]